MTPVVVGSSPISHLVPLGTEHQLLKRVPIFAVWSKAVDGYASGRSFVTYVNAHFAGRPQLAQRIVDEPHQ